MLIFIMILVIIFLLFSFYSLNKSNEEINKSNEEIINNLKKEISKYERSCYEIKEKLSILKEKNTKLLIQVDSRLNPDEETIHKLKNKIYELDKKKFLISSYIKENETIYQDIKEKKSVLEELKEKEINQNNKIKKLWSLFRSIKYSINNFPENQKIIEQTIDDEISIFPDTELKLHHMDIKELNKLFKENQKNIEKVLNYYKVRYTTKNNRTIYNLMVIALQSELQNILYNLKYDKLDKGIENIKNISKKYLKIAEDGNQNIVNTLIAFIGQIEYLFINAVKIEYNYYIKKEQSKQEQLALKQKMKEQAEEIRLLKLQQEKIETEENKFKLELERTKDLLKNTTNDYEIEQINTKIIELQCQLSEITVKKDEIINLQNGKAGNVYIISNLGSFGDNIFKIGMTRRIDPQERINELGSASVPFKFDVHSFIFSENAIELENKLHKILEDKRVNKVNSRKEFFYCTLDELEELVYDIDPTAEFNKTMLAEEFYQSLSINEKNKLEKLS
ncbi:GIY-YIG nuclease family protein [Streptobacillus moniliformis]|uniref:GIY-YIG nuclease family protein n=1 Tax=Streptobacillus moniliformis TaxID=34105 RepID=UPI000A440B9C|nr:GIY-YIG nuclease family protein [Streptobacillus moniliformis]